MAPYIKEKALKKKIKKTQEKKKELVASIRKGIKRTIESDKNNEDIQENVELTCELNENKAFDSLADILSAKTLKCIKNVDLEFMTPVQIKCIPLFLKEGNFRATAKTGSGKTLAFLIPAIELIQKHKFKPKKGTGIIIVSPTRELTMQTFGVLKELALNMSQTIDLLIGGNEIKAEQRRLKKGVNIVVSTPQRLIYHLQNTEGFVFKNCFSVILDEADRLSDGFEEELSKIFEALPTSRQTVLFSATKNENRDTLTNIAAPEAEFVDIDIDEDKSMATVSTLEQSYIVFPMEKKFDCLLTFLKLLQNKKVMVFFNCCESVKFYHHLFNYSQFPVMAIHGNQERSQRNKIYRKFSSATSGTIFCTDIAARGWDIPLVDWVCQYDPPEDATSYIHRVGRTARAGDSGRSLLFLAEEEVQFVSHLNEAKVNVVKKEVAHNITDLTQFQDTFEKIVAENLHMMAKAAFRAHIRAYKKHKLKDVFDIDRLNIRAVSKCFGFRRPPQFTDILKASGKQRTTETEDL